VLNAKNPFIGEKEGGTNTKRNLPAMASLDKGGVSESRGWGGEGAWCGKEQVE